MKLYGLSITSYCGVTLRKLPQEDQFFIANITPRKRVFKVISVPRNIEVIKIKPVKDDRSFKVNIKTSEAKTYKAEFNKPARQFKVIQG